MRPTGPRCSKRPLRPRAGIGAGDVVIAQCAHIRHRLSQTQQGDETDEPTAAVLVIAP